MTALRNGSGPQPWSGSRERSRQIGYASAMAEVAGLIRDMKGKAPEEILAAVLKYADAIHLLGVIPVLTMSELDSCLGWGSPDRPRDGVR